MPCATGLSDAAPTPAGGTAATRAQAALRSAPALSPQLGRQLRNLRRQFQGRRHELPGLIVDAQQHPANLRREADAEGAVPAPVRVRLPGDIRACRS